MGNDEAISWDYIIVGGGSAGCVLAGRLSENPQVRVLLIEAGRDSNDFRVRMPAGVATLVENPRWDWRYRTAPDPSLGNRSFTWSAGRCLGGGSAINGQVFMRGVPEDYDRWASALGNGSSWSYSDMLPYFVTLESFAGAPAANRGAEGPMAVTTVDSPHPLAKKFLAAGHAQGFPGIDLNGGEAEGFGLTQATQHRGQRFSAYDAYVRPHLKRRNLTIMTRSTVSRLLIEGHRVTGVELSKNGTVRTITASREILVCAGAIGSPALLMRSGIGPSETLAAAGIPVVRHLNGVGRNLQEHAGCGISKYIAGRSLNTEQAAHRIAVNLIRYLTRRDGPLAAPVVEAQAYVRTLPSLTFPDLQLHFMPFAYILDAKSKSALTAHMPRRGAVMINATLCRPKARGRVLVTSNDPNADIVIEHLLLSDAGDVATLVRGCRLIETLFEDAALSSDLVEPCNPPDKLSSDDQWTDYVRANSNITYHFAGTCRMGRRDDAEAVVDENLKILGLDGVRVVDASIMPTLTSANTNAPVMAIAEKAAALCRREEVNPDGLKLLLSA